MTLIFHLYASQELYHATAGTHNQATDLLSIFPTSTFLQTQRALLFYHAQQFDEAEPIFSSILAEHPHRLDNLDHYSNILYVTANRPRLAFLAQLATHTDKFRPETCCVVGNYYSLKSDHEKAVMYFRRALTLDRGFLSAWTLMGHEYVEMKNTHAAIESYRHAVDVNRKDYRAWYGLGQAYEVLEMSYYALFYYQRAAGIRPYDSKMWQAVGSCYTKMNQPMQAIKALKRCIVEGTYYDTPQSSFTSALSGHQEKGIPRMDPETLYQVALLYAGLGNMLEAKAYMELTVAQENGLPDTKTTSHLNPTATGSGSGSDTEELDSDNEGARASRRQLAPSTSSRRHEEEDVEDGRRGTGVTATTSRARMWLAKFAFERGEFADAVQLANELCADGVEVEEAKALVRDVRSRTEGVNDG